MRVVLKGFFLLLPMLFFFSSHHANAGVAVACVGADGQVKNASESQVCKAILPKCSEIRSSLEKHAKRVLSLKIFGYYLGKDLDLEKTPNTNDKSKFVGTDLPIPVCSVVGHDLSKSGGEELVHQTVGKKAFCGKRPYASGASGSKTLSLRFLGDEGSLWSAWMLGAYPWGIRANAYDLLNKIKPDLSNLDEILSAEVIQAQKNELMSLEAQSRELFTNLDPSAKVGCSSSPSEIVNQCLNGGFSVSDPALRLCTLVKSQKAMNEGVLANLVVAQIMSKVQAQHDELFFSLIAGKTRPSSSDTGFMNKLVRACNLNTDAGDSPGGEGCGFSRRRYLATTASCLFSGEKFRAWADWHVDEGSSYTCKREGSRASRTRLSDGEVLTNGGGPNVFSVMALGPFALLGGSGGSMNPSDPGLSAQNGFAGGVEYVIRNRICGQTQRGAASAKCDSSESGIPDKPADMEW